MIIAGKIQKKTLQDIILRTHYSIFIVSKFVVLWVESAAQLQNQS